MTPGGSGVALVTGGARGVGLATARALAPSYEVVIADIDAEAGRRAAATLPGATAVGLDVADRDAFAELIASLEQDRGPVDVLVNNAGVMALAPLLDVTGDVVDRTIAVNLGGVVNGMQLALPAMRARGRGHVVNVCSSAGRFGVPGENVYVATKHGVAGLSEVARRELRGSGVHVSVVFFGPTRTPFAAGMRATRAIPMLAPEDVGAAIADVVGTPRFDVWVPRWMGWIETAGHLLPRAVREHVEDLCGLSRVATAIDRDARRGYELETFGTVWEDARIARSA